MCSSSSPSAKDCSAREAAETWVRMSMQYLSSSTILAMPRTCPSMRRNRTRWSSFCEVYPFTISATTSQPRNVPTPTSYPVGVWAGGWCQRHGRALGRGSDRLTRRSVRAAVGGGGRVDGHGPEAAQSQTVGHHEHRGERHRGPGDEGVEQGGDRQRDRGD